jgi:hypothetical protein
MNVEVVSLDRTIEAYKTFDEGSAKKFIIDPHNSLKKATIDRRVIVDRAPHSKNIHK